ncbi:hypothetical protein N9B17_06830, partial [Rhodopirellula sp.]|nr:hypothetical protein [Rhodopirellula sp.]
RKTRPAENHPPLNTLTQLDANDFSTNIASTHHILGGISNEGPAPPNWPRFKLKSLSSDKRKVTWPDTGVFRHSLPDPRHLHPYSRRRPTAKHSESRFGW